MATTDADIASARAKAQRAAHDIQRLAIDPTGSAWVMANAGTGKTKVLTDRLLRLLLHGTAPSKILCLTFTKAAAAEMRNRLSDSLGRWSRLDDAELRQDLQEIAVGHIGGDMLARARSLFARVLDAPGGIYILTLHAFCQAVLQRFPLEAGVPPHFQVLDEGQARELLLGARDQVLECAATDQGLKEALRKVAGRVDGPRFNELLESVLQRRAAMQEGMVKAGGRERYLGRIARLFGARPGETDAGLRGEMANPDAMIEQGLRAACAALLKGSKTDRDRGQAMADLLSAGNDRDGRLDAYCKQFLKTDGEIRDTLATKAIAADIRELLQREGERLCALNRRRLSLGVVERSAALLRLALAVIEAFQRAKRSRAALDYEDLIEHTRALLAGEGGPGWVLYKLDGGFDHVLIDEAQDTSPAQWEVVRRLTEEFFAGETARPEPRTLFVVGDLKQSIYSFQGAEPRQFVEMRGYFERRAEEARQGWQRVPLQASFRSTAAVLQAVDAVFADGVARDGVAEGPADEIKHDPVRLGEAGRVELWPLVEPLPDEKPDPWQDPTEQEGALPPFRRLARLVAAHIRQQIDEEVLPSRNRKVQARDIMVLVQRRNAFVEALVRELKDLEVGVAGVDRLKLTEHIAVMDLIALGQSALLPGDDLTLATVLKGPLVGLDERQLFDLCWNRRRSVWAALRARAEKGEAPYAQAHDFLAPIFARADFVPPFEFYSEVLGRHGGRHKLLARLGPDAADPIDEFLNMALAQQSNEPPSLQAFLHWLAVGQPVIKRELEQGARDEVRILTVHGAKGLQAPIVYLPDTTFDPLRRHEPMVPAAVDGHGLLIWRGAAIDSDEHADRMHGERQARRREENNRLLYVAMTRAADRLYVCGAKGTRDIPANCWYQLIKVALEETAVPADAVPAAAEQPRPLRLPFTLGQSLTDDTSIGGDMLRLDSADVWRLARPARTARLELAGLPDWARRSPAAEPVPPRPLAPSRSEGDAAAEASEPPAFSPLKPDDRQRFKRGLIIHRLLQLLPDLADEQRAAAAARFLARPSLALDAATQAAWAEETLAVLRHPHFAPLFGPGSRAEVPISGTIAGRHGPYVVSGQIDRLLVTPQRVLVLDYKTNRPPPRLVEQVPALYLRQMAAYRRLLGEIWPGRPIEGALLWTDGARLMPLPESLLDAHNP